MPISALADVVLTAGPVEIRHRERLRTITLEVRPAASVPLETALDIMRSEVMQPLIDEGLPGDVRMNALRGGRPAGPKPGRRCR